MNKYRKSSICDADDGRCKKSSDDKLTKKKNSYIYNQRTKMSLIMRAARIAKGKFIG